MVNFVKWKLTLLTKCTGKYCLRFTVKQCFSSATRTTLILAISLGMPVLVLLSTRNRTITSFF